MGTITHKTTRRAERSARAWKIGRIAVAALSLVTVPSIGEAAVADSPNARWTAYVLRFSAGATPQERALVLEGDGVRLRDALEPLGLARVALQRPAVAALRRSPFVEWIHRDRIYQVAATRPNDPLLGSQWALRKMRVFKGWGSAPGGPSKDVVVAIADTGVDPSHPDLQGQLLEGFDFVNNDRDPADDHGHGTHIAGVISARTGNKRGMTGLSRAKILPLKACDVGGACSGFAVVQSIVWAARHDARIVNLSLSGPGGRCPPEFELAMRFAEQHDTMLIAAAGNSGAEGGPNPVNYPAACDGYVSVAASGPRDDWAPFSTHNDYVDLAAPGVAILSTLPPAVTMEDDPASHGYGWADGTSMATPHVVGLAALLIGRNPGWTPLEVQQRLEATSVDLGKPGRDPYFGAGRIDAAAALGEKR